MAALMHVLGTDWREGFPRLVVASGDDRTLVTPAGPLSWDVGERTCTGYYDGAWRPCPDRAATGHETQCLACFRGRGDPDRRDDQPACVFEPLCQGAPERCVCSFGGARQPVPHVVYLAFYGGLPKVGMTMERRVATRLIEQGADAYLVVETCPDRQAARTVEQRVARLHGLPEWRRHDEILPQLTRPVDRARVEAAADQWRSDLADRHDLGPLIHIEHALAPLPGTPRRVAVDGRHEGTWLGGKGNHLFYQGRGGITADGGPVRALARRDLIGRWVRAA